MPVPFLQLPRLVNTDRSPMVNAGRQTDCRQTDCRQTDCHAIRAAVRSRRPVLKIFTDNCGDTRAASPRLIPPGDSSGFL